MAAIPIRPDFEVYRDRPCFVSWKVPSFCNNDWVALELLAMCERMGVSQPFQISYGSPLCAWAGGRPCAIRGRLDEAQLRRYFEAYKRYNVTIALTFSKLKIEKLDLQDPYCNMILNLAEEYQAEAIVVDERLARHIRSTHPGVRLIGSLDRPICEMGPSYSNETSYYLHSLELFDEVVVRCEYALDPDRIAEMPAGNLGRLEVIVNQICVPNCPDSRRHVSAIEAWNDGGCRGACQPCFHADVAADLDRRLVDNVLVSNRRINELAEMGLAKMKIGGRNAPIPKFLDLMSTYIFEPSGAIIPMRVALSRRHASAMRNDPGFAPWNIPTDWA